MHLYQAKYSAIFRHSTEATERQALSLNYQLAHLQAFGMSLRGLLLKHGCSHFHFQAENPPGI